MGSWGCADVGLGVVWFSVCDYCFACGALGGAVEAASVAGGVEENGLACGGLTGTESVNAVFD